MEGTELGCFSGQRSFEVPAPLSEDGGGEEVDVGVGQLLLKKGATRG